MTTILVACAEDCIRELACEMLAASGLTPLPARSESEALAALRASVPAAVIVDCLGGSDLETRWLARIARERPSIPVLALASCDGMSTEQAAAEGAHAVLRKPFSLAQFEAAVADLVAPRMAFGMVGISPAVAQVRRLVGHVADATTTVLVTGESGVGKELVAQSLHARSSRAGAPFVAVHCGALNPGLLESELFGHVRGSFTDAIRDRPGCFERADSGTLFLDEIGTTPLETQVRLLRVLQERQVTRVGDAQPRTVNVRIVAATNEPLAALVKAGRFREDLYYRLNVFPIDVPPLRRRPEDLLPLTRHFLAELCPGRRPPRLSPPVVEALARHGWPGNIRELRNVIERAVLLSDGRAEITLDDIQLARIDGATLDGSMLTLPPGGLSLPELIERIERDLIQQSLTRVGGSRAQAARLLGLKRTTLVQKLKRDGIAACGAA